MAVGACPSCGRPAAPDAAFCGGCGARLVGAGTPGPEVRQTVSALFCDLVGSTALGDTYDPEVLRPALDRYFAAMEAAIARHGGRIEKYIGDAVNAIFGIGAEPADGALAAVRAGLEMQARLAELAADSPIPLAARIGITTAEVVVPASGGIRIGDAMNAASRLQAGAAPGDVVVSGATLALVDQAVSVSGVAEATTSEPAAWLVTSLRGGGA